MSDLPSKPEDLGPMPPRPTDDAPPASPAEAARAASPEAELAALLRSTRARLLALRLGEASLLLGSMIVLLVIAGALLAGLAFARAALFLSGLLLVAAAIAFVIRRVPRSDAELARRWEARDPGAAGLSSAVSIAAELASTGSALRYSDELARAHLAEVAIRVRRVPPSRAFSSRTLRRAGAAFAGSLALAASLVLLVDAVPRGLVRLAGLEDHASAPTPARAAPITSEVTLTYVYPVHTGLTTKTVEGTTGEITAPVGTEVRLVTRADRDVAKAFVELDGASQRLEVTGKRALEGKLLVQRSGAYAFRFEDASGDTIAKGPPIAIVASEDGAPTIELHAPVPELVVQAGEPVELRYEAGDDFGIAKITLRYRVAGGQEQELEVSSHVPTQRRIAGAYRWELSPLGLEEGDELTYYLAAFDNDGVSGAKRGQSRTQHLKIFSAREHRRELLTRVERLWEKLVATLGDRITPREGPRKVEGEARIAAGAPVDEQVQTTATELRELGTELRKDKAAPRELSTATANIADGLLTLGEATRASRLQAKKWGAAGDGAALRRLDVTEGREQQAMERDVLYLEALLDRQRIQEIQALSRQMAASRRELAQLLEDHKAAPTDATKEKIEEEIGRLKERMLEMMAKMAELSRGLQDEHLNAEAMEQLAKEESLFDKLDEVQRLMREGKVDEALAELQKLGLQMDEMAKAFEDAAGSQAQNDPALRELAEDLRRYEEELGELSKSQEKIARETESVKRELRKEAGKELAAKGDELLNELRRKVEQARLALAELPPEELSGRAHEDLGGAQERLEELERALGMSDFDAALESAAKALAHAQSLEELLRGEAAFAQQFEPAREASARAVAQQAGKATPLVREVERKLEELLPDPAQQMSKAQRDQMKQLAEQQQKLGEQMSELAEQAEKIGEKAPIFDEHAKQQMGQAQESMADAQQRLRSRDPGGALSSERSAQEKLRSLQQSLQDAKERAQQNSGGGSGGGFPFPLASRGGHGESGEDGDLSEHEKVTIPGADQYRVPEEYRKDILDAMKQEAPESFKEHVREYYEEIVK